MLESSAAAQLPGLSVTLWQGFTAVPVPVLRESYHVSCSLWAFHEHLGLYCCESCCRCCGVPVTASGAIMEYKMLHPQNNVLQFFAAAG